MKAAWNVDIPADCPGCANGLGAYPAYLRAHAPAGSRWALSMTTRDSVIGSYMGVSAPDLEARTLAIGDGMTAGTGQAAFVVNGTNHVLSGAAPGPTSGGITLYAWIEAFATGGATWRTVGP
jgi:hypothetical protein